MLPQVNLIRAQHGDFLAFYENAGISKVLTEHGVWDELTIAYSKALIESSQSKPLILDVGANMGTFTIPIAKHINNKGFVYSFEPQRIVFYQLCGNIFLNRLNNAYAQNIALSNINEEREIEVLDYAGAHNIGSYSLVPGKDKQNKVNFIKDYCLIQKLDDFKL